MHQQNPYVSIGVCIVDFCEEEADIVFLVLGGRAKIRTCHKHPQYVCIWSLNLSAALPFRSTR